MSADTETPSRMLAYIRDKESPAFRGLCDGPILEATGGFLKELNEGSGGWDIGDHNIPCPSLPGLQLFEGWVEIEPGDDPEVKWVGSWRWLDHWELCRLRTGLRICENW